MVLNSTFNNISVISWQSVLLVEETGIPGENHQPVASHWQTLSHIVVHLALIEIRTHTSVMINNWSGWDVKVCQWLVLHITLCYKVCQWLVLHITLCDKVCQWLVLHITLCDKVWRPLFKQKCDNTGWTVVISIYQINLQLNNFFFLKMTKCCNTHYLGNNNE
jgi:hypothetical protein